MEDDPNNKRKTVGTHTSYMSCCLFPNSDQQVYRLNIKYSRLILKSKFLIDSHWKWRLDVCPLGRGIGTAAAKFSWPQRRCHVDRFGSFRNWKYFRLRGKSFFKKSIKALNILRFSFVFCRVATVRL